MDTSNTTPLSISRLRAGPVLWRGAAFLAVFLSGLVGMLLGVDVSERDLAGSGVATKAYYALGLFVVGGLDLGVPQGGPLIGRIMLWASYFLAPLITVSALVEATLRIIAPLGLRTWRLRDHIIVAGAGRLSLLYIERLRARGRKCDIVVVERNPAHPLISELRRAHRIVFIMGDITRDEVLESLRVERARQVMLLTGDGRRCGSKYESGAVPLSSCTVIASVSRTTTSIHIAWTVRRCQESPLDHGGSSTATGSRHNWRPTTIGHGRRFRPSEPGR